MEALVLLDRYQHNKATAEQFKQNADNFWHGFLAQVAARTKDPFDALGRLMPELGLNTAGSKDEELPYPEEAKLPEPTEDEIADIERWMAEHQSGSITASELPKQRGGTA